MTLLEEANFKSLSELEKFNLNYKGLYALRVIDITRLPKIFQAELLNCKHSIIYIGKAEITLNKRLREECRGESHGTFFRGIGALLNFKPEKGSLINKSNQNNYKFNPRDTKAIINWMNSNLFFNYIKLDKDFDIIEKQLISKTCPILNTTHNPNKSKLLALKRKECREYALSI